MDKLFKYCVLLLLVTGINCKRNSVDNDIDIHEKERVISLANSFLSDNPITITSFTCERSMGGMHDFYSEGDYWWPNPEDPNGPYIRKDGESNPNNFVIHRELMQDFSIKVAALVAAYKITGEEKYAKKAISHLRAWFINSETNMNPNLLYAQAIKGRVTGRGIGIIDTIHLIEVAKAIEILLKYNALKNKDAKVILKWFTDYTYWLTHHKYGTDERDHGNNHSAWWLAQVATYSNLIGDENNLKLCGEFYKNTILPSQIDQEGRFTDELTRTKPYSYSMFNLDAFALICHVLSTSEENLWEYSTPDAKSIKKAFSFLVPFVQDKSIWPYKPDIVYFNDLPVRFSALLFGGLALNKPEYINLWKSLNPDPEERELIRTFVIRQPVLWIE